MRNKIKQLMNKEEGFTLVELLAVIVILGIILAIAIPSIGGVIDRANADATKAENALIQDSARLYFAQNPDADAISVSYLIDNDYVDLRGSELKAEDLSNTDNRYVENDTDLTITTTAPSGYSDPDDL